MEKSKLLIMAGLEGSRNRVVQLTVENRRESAMPNKDLIF